MTKAAPTGANPEAPVFNGSEAAPLDLRTAANWTAAERERHPNEVKAYFFGRNIIESILAQPGCMGLRVYYATDPNTNQRHLLIVGADATQNDQLPGSPVIDAIIAEMAIPCPNQCGNGNSLNSD